MKTYIYHLLSPSDSSLTLCGRKLNGRYNIIDPRVVDNLNPDHGQRLCAVCRKRALRYGILDQSEIKLYGMESSDGSFDTSDEHHDNWLSRLGI